MCPRMSEINAGESQWLKYQDLEKIFSTSWPNVHAELVVQGTSIGEFEPGKPAYNLHLHGIPKPLGCNITNRRTLGAIVGDVDWLDQSAFAGLKLLVYVENTEMGPGIRLRPAPATTQEASANARERIAAAAQSQGYAVQMDPAAVGTPVQTAPAQLPQPPAGPAAHQAPQQSDSFRAANEEVPPHTDFDDVPF